jgi:hypothetical protein
MISLAASLHSISKLIALFSLVAGAACEALVAGAWLHGMLVALISLVAGAACEARR